jgi:hypothetical protein
MKKTTVRWILATVLVAAVVLVSLLPANAIYNACFTCAHVEIPDPTGGSFSDDFCLYDAGNALACVETWGAGGGCILINEGDCN